MKKLFCWVIKITLFYIINSDNQRLIHHIHYFRCIFYHQSMIKKFCWIPRFLFYDLYFWFCLSNFSNFSYSRKHLCIHHDLLQEHFYLHPLLFYVHHYHLQKGIRPWLQFNKFFNSNGRCFIFLPATDFFELS